MTDTTQPPAETLAEAHARLENALDEHFPYAGCRDDLRHIWNALTRRAGGDAIPAKEAFDAWRRAQPSGDERFPYDIAKAAFLAGRESTTPKPPAGGDAGAVEEVVDWDRPLEAVHRDGRVVPVSADPGHDYVEIYIRSDRADFAEGYHNGDGTSSQDDGWTVRNTRAALALPAPVVEGEAFLAQLRRVNTDRYQAWVGDGEDGGLLFDATELGGEVGELLNVVKKADREQRGWRGSRAGPDDFADECADVLICLDKLARRGGVDLEAATIRKFNATSEKHDFPHRLSEGRSHG